MPYEFENLESNSSQQERVINSVVTIPNASIFLLEKTKDRLILNEKYLPVAVDRPTNSNLNPPKRKIEFNVLAGLTHDFSAPEKLGFTSGIEVHVPIRKKWGVQTGIAYTLLSKNEIIQTSQNHEAIIDNNSTFGLNPGQLDLYAINTTANYQLKNIQYLEIPLLVTYQLGRKWQIKLGVNWSKALASNIELFSNQEILTLIDNDPDSALDLPQFSTSGLRAPFVKDETWKNNFVSTVLGVSWSPTTRLRLNLRYHQNWSDLNFLNSSNNRSMADFHSPAGGFDPTLSSSNISEVFDRKKVFYQSLRLTAGYRF